MPTASPSVKLYPWSADLEKAFTQNPDNIKDFGLGSLDQARATLLALSEAPVGPPNLPLTAPLQDRFGRPITPAGTLKTPNARSWTAEEEQHLKEVVEECVSEGLSGEPLWRAAHPRLVARGVNRALGGMKMRWCRGLREETQIDERRKKNNNKMLTALQGPKSTRNPDAQDKDKGKGKEVQADKDFDSSPARKAASNTTSSGAASATVRPLRLVNSSPFNTDFDMPDAGEDTEDEEASNDGLSEGVLNGTRRRARSV